jgi:hypothetical protein
MFVISGAPETTLTSGETLTVHRIGRRTVTVRTETTKEGKIRITLNGVVVYAHPLAVNRVLNRELLKFA